ncbi:MAG: hypothetical protein HQL84_12045 [Magnetococcales bacterium]|nr:hypothetical protein [Magnetococcales bacterium]MBF0150765.1 hypothetical protein [Magnetococcales bacterium]
MITPYRGKGNDSGELKRLHDATIEEYIFLFFVEDKIVFINDFECHSQELRVKMVPITLWTMVRDAGVAVTA